MFGISFRVLRYIRSVEEIGNLMAGKMLGVILLAFLAILLLSNLITALSTFFLAKDLDMLVAAPVGWIRLYLAKLAETVVHSSWMVALMALPIFTAYGIVYDGGLLFPFVALAAFMPSICPAGGRRHGAHADPGQRFSGPSDARAAEPDRHRRGGDRGRVPSLHAAGAAGAAGRVPEPGGVPGGAADADQPLLPSEWAASMIMNWLLRVADPMADRQALGRGAACGGTGSAASTGRCTSSGFSKAQEGAERKVRRPLSGPVSRLLRSQVGPKREFILKDLRLFFRDNTQWSQLILLAVLLMVYIFNIRSLPLHSGERVPFRLVTMISFLNLGLAGFVLAAVAARFIFPGISLEGRQMWLLRSSPLDPSAMLWSKYWIGTVPLLVLALLITVFTNWLLHASRS